MLRKPQPSSFTVKGANVKGKEEPVADPKNPGQFGERSDTQKQARKGGKDSSGSFQSGSQRASDAGKRGAAHQSTEAKRRGGEHSHMND